MSADKDIFSIETLKPEGFEVRFFTSSFIVICCPIKSEDEDFRSIFFKPASILVRNWRM